MRVVAEREMEKYLPLMNKSWREVGFTYEMRPDFARYRALIDMGLYQFFGALDGEKPVGYIGLMHAKSLFNPSKKQTILDSFFVLPEYRNGVASARLFAIAEDAGAGTTMMFGCPKGKELARVLSKRGWKETEVIYTKEM